MPVQFQFAPGSTLACGPTHADVDPRWGKVQRSRRAGLPFPGAFYWTSKFLITLIFLCEQVLAQNFLSPWLLSLSNPVTHVRKGLGVPNLRPLIAVEKSVSFLLENYEYLYCCRLVWLNHNTKFLVFVPTH